MKDKPTDWRDIAVRVILTVALLVIVLCGINIYSVLKAMRSAPSEAGVSPVQMDPAMAEFQPFEFSSGRIEVNGMPVEWRPEVGYDAYVAELREAGWQPVEADWAKVRQVSLSESVMLTQTGELCYVMAIPGESVGILTTRQTLATNEVAFRQNPWTADRDAPGSDLPALPRPLNAVRVFSLLFENGSGAVCYRLPDDKRSNDASSYAARLAAAGWRMQVGAAGQPFAWYERDGQQLLLWMSRPAGLNADFITLLYQAAAQPPEHWSQPAGSG